MKIAVLGGGHGCYAAAADLAEAGHEVRLWRRDGAALAPVIEAGAIVLVDERGRREVAIAMATADLGAALDGAELIVVPSPATAQADIARAMAPHLRSGQVVFLAPGTFGSYVMARIVREQGNRAPRCLGRDRDPALPGAQARRRARCNVTIRAVRLPTGVYPARRAEEALAVIRAAYPRCMAAAMPCRAR